MVERAGNRVNNAFIDKSSPPVQAYVSVNDAEYKAMVEETGQPGREGHAPAGLGSGTGCVHFLTPR